MGPVAQYIISIATVGVIFSIPSLALNIRYGWTGDFDLSIYLFVAIGAYVCSVFVLPPSTLPYPDHYILGLNMPFLVGTLAAMAACGVASAILGAIALRKLRGDYFSIVTVATTLILYAYFSQATSLFDGFNGVFGLPQPFNGQLKLSPNAYPLFFLALCIAILVVVYFFSNLLFRSPFARAVRAVREDEVAAAAFGRNVYLMKLKAFVIGGVIAGLGGSVLVEYLTSWSPQAWSPIETFLLYAAVLVGGTASNNGVVVGAFFIYVFIQEITRFIPSLHLGATSLASARDILIGVLIIGVLWFRPQGIWPEPRDKDVETAVGQQSRPEPLESRPAAGGLT